MCKYVEKYIPNFTPLEEQQRILDTENKNIIVSASAGSGKTTMMVQKILQYILEYGDEIPSLLVLTYTKASAEEMKQKIVKEVYSKAKEFPLLAGKIDDVAIADISTIHSFFQRILKTYFLEVNLNPNFEVIEESESNILKAKAIKMAIKKFQ